MLQVLLTAIGAMGDDEKLRHLLFLLDSLLNLSSITNKNYFSRFGMVMYNSSGDFFHGFHEVFSYFYPAPF